VIGRATDGRSGVAVEGRRQDVATTTVGNSRQSQQNGVSEREMMEMGGWLSAAMVRRYSHLRVQHLAPAASVIDRVLPADRLLAVAEAA